MPFLLKKPADVEGSAAPAIMVGLFVAFGGVLFGYVFYQCNEAIELTVCRYDTGTIGGILAMPYWQDTFSTGYKNEKGHLDITASQSSLIVSILSAGTFFGALSAAPAGDFLGRRMGLIFSTVVVFFLGVILQTAATAIPMFVAGRFFAGYGVGMISALSRWSEVVSHLPFLTFLVPLYQSETAPKWIRGVRMFYVGQP
jgi:SP family sugar:H+ symporter-like MFS transporter